MEDLTGHYLFVLLDGFVLATTYVSHYVLEVRYFVEADVHKPVQFVSEDQLLSQRLGSLVYNELMVEVDQLLLFPHVAEHDGDLVVLAELLLLRVQSGASPPSFLCHFNF